MLYVSISYFKWYIFFHTFHFFTNLSFPFIILFFISLSTHTGGARQGLGGGFEHKIDNAPLTMTSRDYWAKTNICIKSCPPQIKLLAPLYIYICVCVCVCVCDMITNQTSSNFHLSKFNKQKEALVSYNKIYASNIIFLEENN